MAASIWRSSRAAQTRPRPEILSAEIWSAVILSAVILSAVIPRGIFDGVGARLEPARVLPFASHDFVLPAAGLRRDVKGEARKVIHCPVLFACRAQRGLGRGRRRHCCSNQGRNNGN